MDKQQRGLLLADQEELANQIKELVNSAKVMGSHLYQLGTNLQQHAESVILRGAPEGLSEYPQDVRSGTPHDWDKLPDKQTVAQLIFDLKNKQHALKEVQKQLQQK